MTMLKSYFKIARRIITRHKVYSIINVLGLALGICSCVVIYLITYYEFSFDNFHSGKERIYRVTSKEKLTNGDLFFCKSGKKPALRIKE